MVPAKTRTNDMAYSAEISRGNPTCFVFMIDQSGSMSEAFGAEKRAAKG